MDTLDDGGLDPDTREAFGLDEKELLKWRSYVRPLPLPEYQTPTSGIPLADMSDETLLNLPPHLIAHVQRTAAQGGLQVVSPRQTPFSSLMVRTRGGDRKVGDHIVGSIAEPDLLWPTLDGRSLDHLLPDEPLANDDADKAARVKTRTTPLTQATHHLSDPILACLIKGRAVIDVLRRDDVMGGADEFTSVLAKAWGVPAREIDDLDAFTLGVDGPLLRHAIKTDEVFSTFYAPTHVRRCVSVGSSQMTRHYLPDDSAMDWSRMRTHCEAVFVLTCTIEGHPIKRMRPAVPPGDPGARSDRPNVMCFQPAPGTAWTFSAETFSIIPVDNLRLTRASAIPRDVLEALSRYVKVVKPMSYAMSVTSSAKARKTVSLVVEGRTGETLADSYMMMARTISLGASRGKTAAAAVRNVIFTSIEAAELSIRMRIVRYITVAPEECRVHLGLTEVPDRVIERLADRFLKVGELIRLQVVNEAAKRGHTAEEWWSDITAQTPERYKMFAEGTKGWAMVALWLIFREPTDRWRKLVSALKYSALRDAEVGSIGGISLPAAKGSSERLLAAARAATKKISKAYCGYYIGVSDVGMAMSDVADQMGKPRTSQVLKQAAHLWMLRARALRGTNIDPFSKEEPTKSVNHFRVYASPIDLMLVPAPYRAYNAYKNNALKSEILRKPYKDYLMVADDTRISQIFVKCPHPPYHIAKTTLTRYMLEPHELGLDMERAWCMIVEDVRGVAKTYGATDRSRSPSPTRKKPKVIEAQPITVSLVPPPREGMSYWDITADMDEDQVEWVEDLLAEVGPPEEDLFMERNFENEAEFRALLLQIESNMPATKRKASDMVR